MSAHMTNNALQALRKKHRTGRAIVVALLALHGLFLIIIGLIAFFAGFIGVYEVSHGHTTPGSIAAVLGAFVAWLLLLGGIVAFLCALGLLKWQRWAFWLTIALEITNLIAGVFALRLQQFTPWAIALHMGIAGGILLYVLIVIGPRTFSN